MSEAPRPYLMQRGWFWLGVFALACLIVGYQMFFTGPGRQDAEQFVTERYMIPQAAVTEFPVEPSAAVGDRLDDDDLVLGVTIGAAARAYPLAMLNAEPRTKVLNDLLADQAIVVIWCDQCQTGVVYDRVVAGTPLTFSVFGSLWRDNIVFEDQETKTQWSQWEGAAKRGTLQGQTLRRLPCAIATWRSWRAQYPMGDVVLLPNKQADFAQSRYQDSAKFVLAVGDGTHAKAWSLAEIREHGVVNDHWQQRPIVAFFQESSGTARLYERALGKKTLTFRQVARELRDDETDSSWNAVTGSAVAGPLQGAQLTPLPSWVTTRAVWKLFHR